ncbi:MAG: response regulator [Thermoproteota archaeon]|nr:response regulator [Thermoproteota archaeon]
MKERIAVVDDDIGNSLFFKICLEDEGYYADIYNDPSSFLEKFKPGFYHLLLCDIRMPRLNGFELAGRVKSIDKDIGICFTTAFVEYYQSIIEKFDNIDLNCLIEKPTNKKTLIDTITKKINEIDCRYKL